MLGNFGQHLAQPVEHLGLDRGLDVAPRGLVVDRLVEARPASAEPVGLVRLVALGGLELLVEMRDEFCRDLVAVTFVDHALGDEALRIDLGDLRMLADDVVHQRLCELRLVAFVVPEAAITPHVDHHVAPETLAVFDREFAGEGHRFGIVAIDVQDRRHHALRHVAGVGRVAREVGRGGEADLVVDDEVQAAAGVVARHARQREAFPHHALAREGRIAVDQHGQDLLVLLEVVADRLLCAGLAEHDRVHRLKV